MKKTTVSLGGINRNDYDGSAHIVNLRLKDKAFRPVPEPTKVDKEIDGKVEYIHASSDYRNLIDYKHYASVTEVYYRGNLNDNKKEQSILIGSFQAKVLDVSHIGNTLIFLTDDGQYYFLFKNGEYKMLGNKIPEVKVKFRLTPDVVNFADGATSALKNRVHESIYFHPSSTHLDVELKKAMYDGDALSDAQHKITADFDALFNKAMTEIFSIGAVPDFPTQVRTGLRLYDGSYVKQSAPLVLSKGTGKDSILYCMTQFSDAIAFAFSQAGFTHAGQKYLWPVEAGYWRYETAADGSIKEYLTDKGATFPVVYDPMGESLAKLFGMKDRLDFRLNKWTNAQTQAMLRGCRLATRIFFLRAQIEIPAELSDWKDVVTHFDIFTSKPMPPYTPGEISEFPVDENTVFINGYKPSSENDWKLESARDYNKLSPHKRLAQSTDEEIFDAVNENGNFYLLKSIGISDDEYLDAKYLDWFSLSNEIRDNMSLIQQNRLLADDYISRSVTTAKVSYAFNNSLHLADLTTTRFKGFAPDELCVVDPSQDYTGEGYCKVTIEENNQSKVVSISGPLSKEGCFISPMLYYPDTNAVSMEIGVYSKSGELQKSVFELKPHKSLNGASYLSPDLMPIQLKKPAQMPLKEETVSIAEPNKMIATSISNPFVFTAERTNYIGNGKILAMHAATTALSQGQSAQLPLYVFCTDGVYALTTNTQGEYMTSQNVTFDILVDKKKLCSTENAIIFGTRQGLKVIQGGTSALLSAPLNGSAHRYGKGEHYENPYLESFIPGMDMRDFNDFLCDRDTSVHYDYPNNEVWVFNPRSRYAYILSLYNNVWSMRSKDEADSIISAYPSLYLRNGNSLADVTPDNDSKLPFAIITNPIGGIEFTRIADITIDTRFITDNIRCTLLAGNNPFRLAKVRTLRAEKPQGGNPVPTPSLHLGRIPASVRYVQFAMDGHVTEANLTGFTMLTDTESYNPVR